MTGEYIYEQLAREQCIGKEKSAHAINKLRTVSRFRLFAGLFSASTGAASLVIPGILVSSAGNAAWIACVASLVFSLSSALLWIIALNRREPPFGWALSAIYSIASAVGSAFRIGVLSAMAKGLMLEGAPVFALSAVSIVLIIYAARGDAGSLARLAVPGAFFLALSVVSLLFASDNFRLTNMLPLTELRLSDPTLLLSAALCMSFGPETLPLFQSSCDRSKSLVLPAFSACISTNILSLAGFFSALAVFGIYSIKSYTWPLITMLRPSATSGIIRPELVLFVFFYLAAILPPAIGSAAAAKVAPIKKRVFLLIFFVAVFIMSFAISDVADVARLLPFFGASFAVAGLLVPCLSIMFGGKK